MSAENERAPTGLIPESLLRGEAGEPVGDPARQAVAALRGYAYQLYASGLAWADLPPGAELFLEVAEDYAVAVNEALTAVQVKEVSGTVSLASSSARQAISSFVDLVSSNPRRAVRLVFLTTAKVTAERALSHRTGDTPGIECWERAAGGGDVRGLRDVLLRLDLGDVAHRFISERDDDRLRQDLFRRIEWRCGQGGVDEAAPELERRIAQLCLERLDVPTADGERVAGQVLERVLRACLSRGQRKLTYADLNALLDRSTSVTLRRPQLQAFLRGFEQLLGTASAGFGFTEQPWQPLQAIPMPPAVVPRADLVAQVVEAFSRSPAVVLHGGTGMGKTVAARQAVAEVGGQWNALELRGRTPRDAGEALMAYARRGADGARGLVADDVADLHLADSEQGLVRAVRMLADRGERLLITAAHAPTSRVRGLLGMADGAALAMPALSERELLALLEQAGADARWVPHILSASHGGHPQLAGALVAGLAARGWPDEERDTYGLLRGSEVLEEQEAAAQKLVGALPDPGARTMLYRVSIVVGRFPRSVALALGTVPPAAPLPGEAFGRLVGPWIDQVGADRYRISPLLAGAGLRMFAEAEVVAIHAAVAESLTARREVAVDQVDNIFVHGVAGACRPALLKLCLGVLRAPQAQLKQLAPHSVALPLADVSRPILAGDSQLSLMLRVAQVLLASARGFGRRAKAASSALIRELDLLDGKGRAGLEVIALSKLLFREGMSAAIPRWPDLLVRFLDRCRAVPELGADKPGIFGHIGPTLFAFGLLGLRTVDQLADAFGRLSALPAARDELLVAVPGAPALHAQVLSPWLRQRRGSAPDACAAAEIYDGLARLSASWGWRDWGSAFHVAAASIRFRDAGDPAGAEAAVDAALLELGDDRWLRRESQRLRLQRGDDEGAIALVGPLAGSFEDEPAELARVLRDGAVGAARLGRHQLAIEWLRRAERAAQKVGRLDADTFAVGLAAEAAAETWRAGDRPGAFRDLVAVLDRVAALDPSTNVQAGYVHRIVRHSLLWFAGSSGMDSISVEGSPPALPPGACSNPEPPDAIVELPLVSLDIAWYLLAQVASVSGQADLVPDVRSKLHGGPIPGMEASLAKYRLDAAVADVDPEAFLARLPGAAAAAGAMPKLWEEARLGITRWSRGDLPGADFRSDSVRRFVGAAVNAFRLVAGASGRPERAVALRELLTSSPSLGAVSDWKRTFSSPSPERPGSRSVRICVSLVGRADLAPLELLEVCLRVATAFQGSDFWRVCERSFVGWAKKEWLRIATEGRFGLFAPRLSAPAIDSAVQSAGDDVDALRQVLQAALLGVSSPVPPAYLAWIKGGTLVQRDGQANGAVPA